ncbi:MAG TPA: hypothetical protein VGP54_04340, partial [Gaiellaceae bacterium]|nr:hypothetical protein [Gaiellaceae bacterium]
MLEQLDPHVLESARHEHLLPGLGPGRLLPAAEQDAQGVPDETYQPRRPSFEQPGDLLPDES